MALLVPLHILAAMIWVGGMFFAYLVLRPALGPLEPEARAAVWQRVFGHFFPWVWLSVVALLASGYGMLFLYFGGFAGAGWSIHLMQAIGIVMMLLFAYLYFVPWRRFSAAVDGGHSPEAVKQLNQIRRIVATNLVLGILTIVVGASGRFW